MIRIIPGSNEGCDWSCIAHFELTKRLTKCVYESQRDCGTLVFFDDEGYLFSIDTDIENIPRCLGAPVSHARNDLIDILLNSLGVDCKKNQEERDSVYRKTVCNDPRLVFASCMIILATPLEKDCVKIINEALEVLPSYDEAKQWMVDNRFFGENAIKYPGSVGRFVFPYYYEEGLSDYYPKSFFEDKFFGGLVNIPLKIQEAIKKIRRLYDLYSDELSE